MRKFRFYREVDNRWYVDLPDWPGTKSELEMVYGADDMLNYMAEGENEINTYISEDYFEGSDKLEFIRKADELENGAFYLFEKYRGIDVNVTAWLCDVTMHVFNGYFPKIIYISKI